MSFQRSAGEYGFDKGPRLIAKMKSWSLRFINRRFSIDVGPQFLSSGVGGWWLAIAKVKTL